MKLVLQIAAGVFLGMLTIFGVYTLVQKREAHAYAQRLAEQQRLEADARQAAMAHAIKRVQDLTPTTLTSMCGSPLDSSVRNTKTKDFYFLAMRYMGSDGRKIEMMFQCIEVEGFGCRGADMARTEHYVYDSPAPYEIYRKDDGTFYEPPPMKLIEELPCLAGQK